MALRNSVLADVWASIERSPFSPADFELISTEREPLSIKFRHHPAFQFRLIRVSGGSGFSVAMSPGVHEVKENRPINGVQFLPNEIQLWTTHIREELRAMIPVYAELDKLRETIEKHVNEHVTDAEANFTPDEVAELSGKLDDLMSKFREMEERHELTKQEVGRLDKELEAIKANLSGYSKGVWYKTAANKLWIAVSKVGTSKESRQVLAKAAQRMLGLDE